MADRLKLIRSPSSTWVDWWGGTSGGAAAVAAVLPDARRHVAEPTAEWVDRSRQLNRGPWWAALGRAAADRRVVLDSEVAPDLAQMVWANMMLHRCANPQTQMAQWHSALQVGGYLMFSTLGPSSLRALRQVFADRGWPAPHAPFVDMHDLGDQLVGIGFADPVMDQENLHLSWSSPQALLDELRSLGSNLQPQRMPGLRTPRWRHQLHDALAALTDAKGRISLSFEVVYGHAFKAPPKPLRGDTAVVSLESLRSRLKAGADPAN